VDWIRPPSTAACVSRSAWPSTTGWSPAGPGGRSVRDRRRVLSWRIAISIKTALILNSLKQDDPILDPS